MTSEPPPITRLALIVMGVAGCGKSTLGAALAAALELRFVDGDDLHSRTAIEKMRRGAPLNDDDRLPWLDAIAAALADSARDPRGMVIACSALRRGYRDRLRRVPDLRFIFLDADPALIEQRMRERQHHFMPLALIASQFATLERPDDTEGDVLTLAAQLPLADMVQRILSALAAPGGFSRRDQPVA
jgi:gluconokinase